MADYNPMCHCSCVAGDAINVILLPDWNRMMIGKLWVEAVGET